MLSLISYFAAFVVSVVIMVVTDDDPTSVSLVEWAMFGVMAYSANELRKRLMKIYRRGNWD
ncbi:hypothetical protein [Methylogaea oryzae]|uniref:Uncharacterized protein n=1 Tax=Methylogaea oryzae TaxID=1295382 RepID=A0A8D4VK10_9GAMM|nr:hypothetical protein [Methylogaea oryzae]BBL69503.1 hypothetical protein MoryE10_01090 [Methylogaea oryzae]